MYHGKNILTSSNGMSEMDMVERYAIKFVEKAGVCEILH